MNVVDTIAWHARKARQSAARVIASPRVPQPRTEEDALQADAVERIRRAVAAAVSPRRSR